MVNFLKEREFSAANHNRAQGRSEEELSYE
jgi:hypothetical protein